MAKKKETQAKAPDGVLIAAAKTIGAVAGKVAAAVGVTVPPKSTVTTPVKKSKDRLPRRQKKAARKAVKPT